MPHWNSAARLLLLKYSVGESKGFFLHSGLIGQNQRPARLLECPPRREESTEEYSAALAAASRQLPGPVTALVVVIKQAHNSKHPKDFFYSFFFLENLKHLLIKILSYGFRIRALAAGSS